MLIEGLKESEDDHNLSGNLYVNTEPIKPGKFKMKIRDRKLTEPSSRGTNPQSQKMHNQSHSSSKLSPSARHEASKELFSLDN